MAIKLDSKPVDVSTVEDKKIKVKFNASTIVIFDEEVFNANELFEVNGKAKFMPFPRNKVVTKNADGTKTENIIYSTFMYGQIVELTQKQYDKVKNRKVNVNNERMGNLHEEYEKRMQGATRGEKEYIEANKHEFEACQFEKPLCELVA